ncbi:hypothetical protein C6P40_002900 [Pichia californica]|uniref:Endoplasmic reticulum-Golgi intermediate compartment protein n=1 Tax=Pichia californica TaxID=460514 RepID=A0A9P6WH47_9ASCO|nr:hypothetical protein C6P42_002717 [[Candida] californica]KAG0687075.1 hypothetical protein C6P40_002900 [[Candida] californica]
MSKAPSLFSLDAFAKTMDDRKIKTSSGGIITIICCITTFFLLFNEYQDYNRIVLRPELVVDRDRDNNLDINLDISFPHLPCDLISLDVMDLTGDIEFDLLKNGFTKYRLDSNGKEIGESSFDANEQNNDVETVGASGGYCGPCYGAVNQNGNDDKPDNEKICCNTCEQVRVAYSKAAWKFYDGKDVEQCEREGYVKRINERLNEGCRIKGIAEINKIGGNIHFAPGASISIGGKHVHDMSLFDKHTDKFSFAHTINHFSFGENNEDVNAIFQNDSHDHRTSSPLDGKSIDANNKYEMYTYYLKVVNTRFEYINGDMVETNEFSATQHNRPLKGGRDDDHPNTIHARGGIPSLFFYFDISPLKIINREEYNKSFSAFLLSLCSAIAGILTVGAILDRTIWSARRFIKEKKST